MPNEINYYIIVKSLCNLLLIIYSNITAIFEISQYDITEIVTRIDNLIKTIFINVNFF
jgi:hypothetical protein